LGGNKVCVRLKANNRKKSEQDLGARFSPWSRVAKERVADYSIREDGLISGSLIQYSRVERRVSVRG
jgi:hypothetical protein